MIINFCGDLCLSESLDKQVVDKIRNEVFNNYPAILNLEGPILDNTVEYGKIFKSGPAISGHNSTSKLLSELDVIGVSLANNHIMDYGDKGLLSTTKMLEKISVEYSGVISSEKFKDNFIIKNNGITVCIISICEEEWGGAKGNLGGSNTFKLHALSNKIKTLCELYDHVIISYHGGLEFSSTPSPELVDNMRYLTEQGASLIICHHTHRVNCFEYWNGVPIFFGLGNFIFNKAESSNCWRESLVLTIDFSKSALTVLSSKVIRFNQNFTDFDFLDGTINDAYINRDIEEYKLEWKREIYQQLDFHLSTVSPLQSINNRYLRFILKKLGINKLIFNSRYISFLRTVLVNDSIRNATIEALEQKLEIIENESSSRE